MRRLFWLFLCLLFFASAEAQTLTDLFVNTSCSTNGDGSSRTCTTGAAGTPGANTTVANALSRLQTLCSNTKTLTTCDRNAVINVSGTAADGLINIDAWTTDATRFITIRCDTGSGSGCNNTAQWSTAFYRSSSNQFDGAVRINNTSHVDIIGIQAENTGDAAGGGPYRGIRTSNVPAGARYRVIGNIFRYNPAGGSPTANTNNDGIGITGETQVIANNIVYGFQQDGIDVTSIFISNVNMAVYSNTVQRVGGVGLRVAADGSNDTIRIRNNILSATGSDYLFTSTATTLQTSNNLTADATSPDGASWQNKVPTFTNAASDIYTLTSSDTNARDAGADLSAAAIYSFANDIAGTARPQNSLWDVGAHELVVAAPTPTPTATPTATPSPTPTATPTPTAPPIFSNAGLVWADGIEPGDPSTCEAPAGKSCYWVDCDKGSNGAGTYADPDWGFETIFGYYSSGNYQLGVARGGDIVYVKGTCEATGSVDSATGPYKQVRLARGVQYGTLTDPITIKSWRGTPRAVFDGEYAQSLAVQNDGNNAPSSLMRFWDTNSTGGYVRLQNIRLTRWYAIGAGHSGDVRGIDVYSVEADNGRMDKFVGTGGAITMQLLSTHATASVIRNSYFHDITNNCGLGGDADCGIDNNDGTICVLSESGATGSVTIRDSLFDNNLRHVRDKHNGQATVYVYGNLFKGGENAFHRRAQDYYIYNNIFSGITGKLIETETATASTPANTRFYNNSVYNIGTFIGIASSWTDDGFFEIYNNAFDSASSSTVPFINFGSGGSMDPTDFIQDRNYFRISATQQATFSCLGPTPPSTGTCTNRSFATHNTYVSDVGSATTNPNFGAPASGNFYIAAGDPACTAGRSGTYLGALPCSGGGASGSNSGAGNNWFLREQRRRR